MTTNLSTLNVPPIVADLDTSKSSSSVADFPNKSDYLIVTEPLISNVPFIEQDPFMVAVLPTNKLEFKVAALSTFNNELTEHDPNIIVFLVT